jgi:hypothetical protein
MPAWLHSVRNTEELTPAPDPVPGMCSAFGYGGPLNRSTQFACRCSLGGSGQH